MKKFTSILLILGLVFCLFSACSSTMEQESTTSAAVASESAEAPSATPVPEDTRQSASETASSASEDSVAESVSTSASKPPKYELPLTTGGESLTMFAISNSNVTDYIGDLNNHQIYMAAEEITGVTVDIQTYQQETSTEQFSLVLASGDYPDMVRSGVYPSGISAAFEEDIIIDFADYLEFAPNYADILDNNPGVAQDAKTDDGNILSLYYLNAYLGKFEVPITEGPVIRKDLLEDAGLDSPTSVEELHDVLTALKSAYDLDDPLYLGNTVFAASGFLMGAYDVSAELYQVDGVVKYGPLEEGFRSYLETMIAWYQEGLLNADFYSYDDNPMSTVTEGKKVNGDIGVFAAPAANLSAYCSDAAYYTGMQILPNADGENHLTSTTKVVDTSKGMTITTGCENVELAVQWCDFWYSEEGQLLSNYGLEGVTFTYDAEGNPHWTELLTANADGMSLGIARQVYTTLTQQPGVCPKEIEMDLLDENALASVEIWGSSGDGDYTMPNVSLTSEESARAAQIFSDIDTLNNETWFKILLGQQSIDTWGDYLASIREMGIDEYIAIYQTALDRYNQR